MATNNAANNLSTGLPYYFQSYVNSTVSGVTGSGTSYIIVFNDTTKNEGGGLDTGTGIFEGPSDGLYQFNVNLVLTGLVVANTSMSVSLYEPTGLIVYQELFSGNPYVLANGGSLSLSLSAAQNSGPSLASLAVQIIVSGNGADNVDIVGNAGAPFRTAFSGYKVGD